LTATEARETGDAICDFLQAQGGPYTQLNPEVVRNVYWALGAGHYVWSPGRYYACYWCIHPEDVESVRERIKPLDITHGSVMYVAEAASTVGLGEVIKTLRKQAIGMKGLFWHRPTKQDKVYCFPSQVGGSDGITRE
jgi:hypothetical protein